MSRITEVEVGDAVLHILASSPNGQATVTKLKAELPNHVRLSAEDQIGSETRTNEEIWEQQVRNLKSHDKTSRVKSYAFAKDPDARWRYLCKDCVGSVCAFKERKPQKKREFAVRVLNTARDKSLSTIIRGVGHDIVRR